MSDKALEDIPQTIKIVDDIIGYDVTYKDHLSHIINIVSLCDQHGITLNRERFNSWENVIHFCGYNKSSLEYTSDVQKPKAIADVLRPHDITDLCSFMGPTNQLGSFSAAIPDAAQPLWDLFRPKNRRRWSQHYDKMFKWVKKYLVSPAIIGFFDPPLPTLLQTDASRLHRFRFVLLQKHGEDSELVAWIQISFWKESRYVVIKAELPAVLWTIGKCKTYHTGMSHFDLVIKHRPLVLILNSKILGETENLHLQCQKENLTGCSFTARWQKGTAHCASDTLSQVPVQDAGSHDDTTDNEDVDPLRAVVTMMWILSMLAADNGCGLVSS